MADVFGAAAHFLCGVPLGLEAVLNVVVSSCNAMVRTSSGSRFITAASSRTRCATARSTRIRYVVARCWYGCASVLFSRTMMSKPARRGRAAELRHHGSVGVCQRGTWRYWNVVRRRRRRVRTVSFRVAGGVAGVERRGLMSSCFCLGGCGLVVVQRRRLDCGERGINPV